MNKDTHARAQNIKKMEEKLGVLIINQFRINMQKTKAVLPINHPMRFNFKVNVLYNLNKHSNSLQFLVYFPVIINLCSINNLEVIKFNKSWKENGQLPFDNYKKIKNLIIILNWLIFILKKEVLI